MFPKPPSPSVGRGPLPRHAMIAGDRPPRYGDREIAGDRPPRYGIQTGFFYRRARACPSPCCGLSEVRGGNPLGCAYGIRGPPRYGIQNGSFYRRARACPSPCCGPPNDRGGQAPALRAFGISPSVGRGPVPRHASIYRTIAVETRSDARVASEGPRATGLWNFSFRRARACPSPCFDLPNDRGGNPLGCACGIRGPPRYGPLEFLLP